MKVRQAKDAARRWVMEEGSKTPNFFGAYLHGSANWLTDDATLPATSDTDVMLVLAGAEPPIKPGKFHYHGVLLEVSYISRDTLSSPEAVLGRGHLAGGFRTRSIILDPSGELSALQEVVSREYARRSWVRTRCERAADSVRSWSLDEAAPLHDQATTAVFTAGVTTYVLLAAGLKNPTVRKRYVASREVLVEYGRVDFQERLLELLGCAAMSRERVEHHLDGVTAAFDAASRVTIKTPYRFASDISAAARPISIDGSHELIERGLHREAVFWLAATHGRCRTIFAADAPELVPRFDPSYGELLDDLGIGSFEDRRWRCEAVEAFLPRVWEVAEEIMAANPDIED